MKKETKRINMLAAAAQAIKFYKTVLFFFDQSNVCGCQQDGWLLLLVLVLLFFHILVVIKR